MNNLYFKLYFCGMSNKTFTEHIMIYKPYKRIVNNFTVGKLDKLRIFRVSDLIAHLKTNKTISEGLGIWGMESFSYKTICIRYKDYLLGLKEDKTIDEIFDYIVTDQLNFYNWGGVHLFIMKPTIDLLCILMKKSMSICPMYIYQKQVLT